MSRHLKRIAAPKTWPITRKRTKYVIKPLAGPHRIDRCMPLGVMIKDILNIANTNREVKFILNSGNVLVNNKVRKEPKFGAGLLDVISVKGVGNYRVLFDENGKLILKNSKSDGKIKIVKIISKTTLNGKLTQLNFLDGSNLLVSKDTYKVGDSLILDGKTVVKHLKFEKGAYLYLIGGRHVGKLGSLDDVRTFKGIHPDRIILNIGKEKAETLKAYAIVVDEGFENE